MDWFRPEPPEQAPLPAITPEGESELEREQKRLERAWVLTSMQGTPLQPNDQSRAMFG